MAVRPYNVGRSNVYIRRLVTAGVRPLTLCQIILILAEGHDRIAERYAQWGQHNTVDEVRPRYVSLLLDQLPEGVDVLEFGCGGGGSTTRQLAERFALTGVDLSARQIELARQNLPEATFIHADMTKLELPPASFDAVVALYSLTHLPYSDLPGVLLKIGSWLRPGGLLLATIGARSDPGTVEPNWLGAPMYFSGYGVEENCRYVEQAGLTIESAQVEVIFEDGEPVKFLWVVARRV
jgi:SAM-dependent methyltransferase